MPTSPAAPWGSFQFDAYSRNPGFPPWIAQSRDQGLGEGAGARAPSPFPAGDGNPPFALRPSPDSAGKAPGTRSPEQAPTVPTPQSPLSHHARLPEPGTPAGALTGHRRAKTTKISVPGPQSGSLALRTCTGAGDRGAGAPEAACALCPRCPVLLGGAPGPDRVFIKSRL